MNYLEQQYWEEKCQQELLEHKERMSMLIYQQRPSVRMKPILTKDGNQWCALYGENLQVGIAGFGDTPELALEEFDKNWYKG